MDCAKCIKKQTKFRELSEKFCMKKFAKSLEKLRAIQYNKQCCDIDSVEA